VKINFVGLVCHLQLKFNGGPLHRAAVLMASDDHDPMLRVKPDDLDKARTTAPHIVRDGYWQFDLNGTVTTNTDGQVAFPARELEGLIPSVVTDFMAGNGSLHQNLLKKTPDYNYFAAFFDVPWGTFSADHFFQDAAKYVHMTPGGTVEHYFGCVALAVTLTLASQGDVKFTLGNQGDVVAHSTAELWARNVCENVQPPHDHSKAYGNLFDPPVTVATPSKAGTCSQPQEPEEVRTSVKIDTVDIDCSNSRFP
jgi:hypothetical protein